MPSTSRLPATPAAAFDQNPSPRHFRLYSWNATGGASTPPCLGSAASRSSCVFSRPSGDDEAKYDITPPTTKAATIPTISVLRL